ncbi:Zn(II)2Cys6 transcription factor [Aspergillus ibericus CBS 121593]|uniref:Zn(2)-C6 fungal-type domain-containing protein n=1 Tax=Aspergillus ibericus CBS 121593 TaxID=1448316 RepID=A0A395GWB2_9EURO|nr:hypothetical protein BO80DRAFT_359609 [Aspergillus ibericus CBS 121593]RAK99308.1 hypothetical protein BO80DRAFT_359609 [Aspergillus ibericus CBS 121593]
MPPTTSYRRPRIRKSRGRGLRTKNGCITCRKRHLKCDEVKPICGPCAKKDKTCEYPTSGRRSPPPDRAIDVGPVSAQEATQGQTNDSPSDVAIPGPVPYEPHDSTGLSWNCSDADVNPPLPAVLDHLPASDLTVSQSPIAFPHAYLSPSNASFAAVRWFGLLASDAARDSPLLSTAPNSHANQDISIDHYGAEGLKQPRSLQYATQVLDNIDIDGGPDAGVNAGGSPLEEALIWQSQESIELLPTEQALFEHFVNQLDLFDPTSQFSTFVAHLAIHNAGLMNAILALAFRHLALNPRLDNQEMPNKGEAALQYYYQTLHYVQRAMRFSSYKTSLELLATALIISAYEMLDNSTNDWERHLEGVFLIQRSQTIHGESGGLHSAVWWAWLCQDIWAAFREKRKTLTFWVPSKPLPALLPHELAMRAIYITAKVISYCADSTTEEEMQRKVEEASRLRAMLDDWRQHLTVEFSPLPLGLALAVQFFNASYTLLLAHEPSLGGLDQYLKRQSAIKRHVGEICGIAMMLKDSASSLMSSQALFIGT